MHGAGRSGHGERARVERRVREILGSGASSDAGSGSAGIVAARTRHRAPNLAARLLARSGMRIDASRATAVATSVVLLVVVLFVGAWVLSSRPRAAPVPSQSASLLIAPRPPTQSATPSATGTARSPDAVVVDVAGKVRRPGIYRLPAGSRVDDAVRAAGGALPGVDLSTVNLAAPLVDGQQVAVGVAAAAAVAPTGTPRPGSAPTTVRLNSATIEQLETLPGVGPVLAQHILDYRAAHGSFASVGQLNDVPGIGDSKFAALRNSVAL